MGNTQGERGNQVQCYGRKASGSTDSKNVPIVPSAIFFENGLSRGKKGEVEGGGSLTSMETAVPYGEVYRATTASSYFQNSRYPSKLTISSIHDILEDALRRAFPLLEGHGEEAREPEEHPRAGKKPRTILPNADKHPVADGYSPPLSMHRVRGSRQLVTTSPSTAGRT
ncbi:hypothetical protein KM043_009900 [Ampulex compressa]|nr:hypothetical protein KM043_009900 [Ampulex compressa]